MNRTQRLTAITAIALTTVGFTGVATATAAEAAPARTSATVMAKGKSVASVTIYLTRHGRTILNQTDTVQGWADSPLLIGTTDYATPVNGVVPTVDAGRPLARAVGANLADAVGSFDAAYSADGKRHFETATYLLEGAGARLSVAQDAGLREANFGKYEGKENEEMWTDGVEHLGYVIDNSNGPRGCVVQGEDELCDIGGWQTMQGVSVAEHGLWTVMDAIKAVADDPAHGLPAENCAQVNERMTNSLLAIGKAAAKKHQDAVLVVSSGLSIHCFATSPDIRTVDGAVPANPVNGVPNVAVTKLVYSDGQLRIDGPIGDTSYYPQG